MSQEKNVYQFRGGSKYVLDEELARIVNVSIVNFSLSLDFITSAAFLRAFVVFANGILRRRWGMKPSIQSGLDPRALLKFGLARAFKALKVQKAREYKLTENFHLREAVPGTAANRAQQQPFPIADVA